jgi:uncharacterized protein (PEP-CTERM system associated)
MKQKKTSARRSITVTGAVLVALAGAAAMPAAAEATFEPSLGLDLMWLDNLNLASAEEAKQEEYIGQVTPGLRLTQTSRRFDAYLDYKLQALFYEKDSEQNDAFHNASVSADITAVEDWFFIGMDGSYFQSIVDPEQPVNTNNLFNVGNTSDTAAGRITPQLRHRFSSVQVDASYSLGWVDYRDSGTSQQTLLDDSRNEDAVAQLSSADAEATVTWLARYDYQHAEYDVSLPFEFERAFGELGVRVAEGLRLIGRGGVESDPFSVPADGGLEESFWAGGFSYSRGQRLDLQVLVGERFFGTSYDAVLRSRGRVLQLEVGYSESPTTQTQRVAMRDVQTPDPALPVGPVAPEDALFGRATSEVYLLKRAYAQLAATGRVTRVGLDVSAEKRKYVLLAGIEDEFRSGRLFLTREFGQRTSGEVSVGIVETDLRDGGSFRDQQYDLRLSREIGARTSVSLAGHHLRRGGDIDEYDANWVSIGMQMTF